MEYIAWPAAVLIFGIIALVMFKRNIAGRIDKIQKIDKIGVSIGTEQSQAVSETKGNAFYELMDAVNSPLLRQRESELREELKSKSITSPEETNRILTRALAKCLLNLQWTQIERDIFGSQLNMLVTINSAANGLTVEQIKPFYDAAVKQFPATYENYSFAQWLQFIEAMRLIAKGGNGYQITLEGKEFMTWMVQVGRTHPHPN